MLMANITLRCQCNILRFLFHCTSCQSDRTTNSHSTSHTDLPSFIVNSGPAYFWNTALRPYVTVQYTRTCRGGELVGVCDVCVTCGEGRVKQEVNSLCYIRRAHPLTWPTVWLSPDWCCVLHQPVACRVYLLQPRQRGQHPDAANRGVSKDHSLQKTMSNLLFPVWDYLPVHHVRRNYQE